MKKWKLGLIVSLIVIILGIIVENIFISNDFIWNIGRIMIFASIATFIINLIIGIFLSIKEKKKIPLWVDIVIAIVIAFIVILIGGTISGNKLNKTYNEQYQDNLERLNGNKGIMPPDKINTNSDIEKSIKTFDEVANEYNLTPEELEDMIEKGITPDDL